MEKIVLFFISLQCFAQVGIGTTTPDVNSMLHIANPNGVTTPLKVEGLPIMAGEDTILVIDDNDNVGTRTLPVSSGGLIVGIMNISEWRGAPLDITIGTAPYLDDYIDLDLETQVTVAAGTTAIVDIHYSVPVGIGVSSTSVNTNIGVFLERDGVKMVNTESSVKVTQDKDHHQLQMYYTDWISNNTGSPITVTYKLFGYLNQVLSYDTVTYRFKRFNIDDSLNENWGKMQMHTRVWRL